ETICPRRYIERYQEIKREYGALRIVSRPSGADVYLSGSRTSAGKTPLTLGHREGEVKIEVKKGSKTKEDTLRVVAGKETTSPEYILKGKSSMLLIVGGIALAGGLGAALLLGGGSKDPGPSPTPTPTPTTGSFQINSNPDGATILLNGNDTGRTTNATLTDLSPGSYVIGLIKEGYEDYEETASIVAGQTETVSASLQQHEIAVTNPTSNDYLTKGRDIEIRWEVSGLSAKSKRAGSHVRTNGSAKSLRRSVLMAQRRALRSRYSLGVSLNNSRRNGTIHSSRYGVTRAVEFSSSAREHTGIEEKALTKNPSSMGQGSKDGRLARIDLSDPARLNTNLRLNKNTTPPNKVQPATLTNVRIELYRSGNQVKTIANKTESDGVHIWTVNSNLQDDWGYIIRVSSNTEPDVYGESEDFSILKAGNFDEHFDDDTIVKNSFTESHPNAWNVEGGVYKITRIAGLNERSWSYFNPGDYSDFTCEVKCGNGNSEVWYGIAFRGTDNFNNFHFFYVSTEGTWQLKERIDGSHEETIEEKTSSAIKMGFNKWNTLKVEAIGHNFRFYINGVLVHSAFLSNLALDGKICLVTRKNYSNAKFDDLSVRIID
ncbi:MAG: PEGA domain-containing protein, partial [Candidatus Aminicenantes bacterium]|nr:PEGA domain-containing protein [Candidatus Aminicenantes bacterium]